MKLPLILLALLAATPAHAADWKQGLTPAEIAFQTLNVGDAIETCGSASHRGSRFTEANPLYGGAHPPCARVVAIKALEGVGHLLVTRYLEDHHAPRWTTTVWQATTIGIQATIDGHNLAVVGFGFRF